MTAALPPIDIAGAGPAGLSAALAIVEQGGRVRVFERRSEVGGRFHGDFQGLENWSVEEDVLDELGRFGIEPSFEYTPFRECVFFDPEGREHVCRSERPLWYQVRRGSGPGTLDTALKDQALAAGVEIEVGHAATHLPGGGIVAHGPRRVDAIAVGYVFDTDRADGAYAVVSNELAPQGYSYLLVAGGRATLAACMFADFHNERIYLERSLDFFQSKVGIALHNEKRFGGYGNMAAAPRLRRGNLLFAGEAAGLQDTLFGFGMRYALVSGHWAGLAVAGGDLQSYEAACERRLLSLSRAAAVNRHLFSRIGDRGASALFRRVCEAPDPRAWLRHYYEARWWTSVLFPVARLAAERKRHKSVEHVCQDGCDCTYCRCVREARAARRRDRARESALVEAGV